MPRRLISPTVGAIIGWLVVGPALDRTPPYTRSGGMIVPAPPETEIVRGRSVQVMYDVKIWRRCPGKVTRHIIDGATIDHDYASKEALVFGQAKDDPVFRQEFILPMSTPQAVANDWQYYADIDYYCNWTQHIYPIKERTPTINFRVVR
jgi:hypothetical protein